MNKKFQKYCSILLSRQALHPCKSSPWVSQTIKAIKWIKDKNYALITSIGQNTWELSLFLAQREKINLCIYIPVKKKSDFEIQKQEIIIQFQLNSSNTIFKPVYSNESSKLLYKRDEAVIFNSNIVIPVSIRKKGHMEALINKKQKIHPEVLVEEFKINYCKNKKAIAYRLNEDDISQDIFQLKHKYLIHWTRTSNGSWPTELKSHYYNSIIENNTYPRNALNTLENILQLSLIKASVRHMPKKIPTVSFSSLTPDKATNLMRWRARYRQMSFEPYGIGLEQNYAKNIGIQKVKYYQPPKKPDKLATWLYQSKGTKSDWQLENEYRHLGDLKLSNIPSDKLIIFCFHFKEAIEIKKKFNVQTIALCK